MLLRVLLVGSETVSRRQLRQHLEALDQVVIVGEARDLVEALPAAKRGTDVAIVEVSAGAGEAQALDCIGHLLQLIPGISVMASSGPDGSTELVIRALRAGAVEFLRRPISSDDLAAAIEKVRRLRRVSPVTEGQVGQVTSVYSTKGGLGVTMLATNLAVCLAQRAPDNVVLLDLDLRQGGVRTLLNLEANYCVLDAFEQTHRLDEAFLRGLVVRHPCGLNILAAPSEMVRTRITPEQMREGLEVIRTHFQHTILDLPHDLDPGTITALEDSDKILYLVGLNVPAMRAAAAGLAAFRNLGIDPRKVKVVVCRADAREEVSLKQARESLGMPILWQTPNDYPTVVSSINQGTPLVLASPRTEIARNLRMLSDHLNDASDGSMGTGEDDGASHSSLRRAWTSLRAKFTGEGDEDGRESQRDQAASPGSPVVHRRLQHGGQVRGNGRPEDGILHGSLAEAAAPGGEVRQERGGPALEPTGPRLHDDIASPPEKPGDTEPGETSHGASPRDRAAGWETGEEEIHAEAGRRYPAQPHGSEGPGGLDEGLDVVPKAETATPRRPARRWPIERPDRSGNGGQSPPGNRVTETVRQGLPRRGGGRYPEPRPARLAAASTSGGAFRSGPAPGRPDAVASSASG